ncbi:MAG: hypothetical protein NNA23_12445 [Nitrospira sp.]|nr:hypothetical protein [Nitrospira sp.]
MLGGDTVYLVMRDQCRKSGLLRVIVLAWVGLWVLLVPFVHIHPDADHRHGADGHTHGGLVHTIWSPDLECEFDHHGNIHQEWDDANDDVEHRDSLFHAGDHHAEFALTMLGDSSDRRLVPSPSAHPVAVTQPGLSEPDCEVRFGRPADERPRLILLLNNRFSRAPPFFQS